MRGSARVLVVAVCVGGIWGCDDDGGGGVPDTGSGDSGGEVVADSGSDGDALGDPDAGPGFEIGAISWSACALNEDGSDSDGECANVDVPLDWDDPEGETISLFVRRSPALGAVAGQIWVIVGGPGFSTANLGPALRAFGELHPSFDVYGMDHRGVGQSTRLGCPDQEADESAGGSIIEDSEWADCQAAAVAEWGDGLAHFSTTQAAYDYSALIEATRPTTGDVFLVGISYGGYLTFRFLDLFPEQVTAVVLDSPAVPGAQLDEFAQQFEAVGEALMNRCGEDEFCSEKLGDDPWATAQDIVANIDTTCPELEADPLLLRRALGYLAEQPHPWEATAPALIYRLQRCDEADVDIIDGLLFQFTQTSPLPTGEFSFLLSLNILGSELWGDRESTREDFEAAELELTFSNALGSFNASRVAGWPIYAEPLAGVWPETDVPMLILAGALDPRTPVASARDASERFNGPNQHLVEFANARHTGAGTSFISANQTCGLIIAHAFVDDPTSELDLSCLDELVPMDFEGSATLADALFGTDDLWENE